MEIAEINTIRFTYTGTGRTDDEGHLHPGEAHESTGTLTEVVTDTGEAGYHFGGSKRANDAAEDIVAGWDPFDREKIWRKLFRTQRIRGKRGMTNNNIAAVDCALWDLAGRHAGLPVYKLVGGARDSVPAYASTYPGDDDPEGLGTPEAYADFALELLDRGYQAVKLHTWMEPYDPEPDRVIAACRAVREAVGPDVDLMLDPHHNYSRAEARKIGLALGELDYLWYEEPMDEYSVAAYRYLTREVDVPVVGPETAQGKHRTRADWITQDAMDVCRVGVEGDVGGFTPALKVVDLCDSFNVDCEVHGGGATSLHLLGTMGFPGRYLERGLYHPKEAEGDDHPGLNAPVDPMDDDGVVTIPDEPGFGYDIDWEYVDDHRVEAE